MPPDPSLGWAWVWSASACVVGCDCVASTTANRSIHSPGHGLERRFPRVHSRACLGASATVSSVKGTAPLRAGFDSRQAQESQTRTLFE
jgi:hypothetical protein